MENIDMLENAMTMNPCCPMMRCSKYLMCSLEQFILNDFHNNMKLKRIPAEEIED